MRTSKNLQMHQDDNKPKNIKNETFVIPANKRNQRETILTTRHLRSSVFRKCFNIGNQTF